MNMTEPDPDLLEFDWIECIKLSQINCGSFFCELIMPGQSFHTSVLLKPILDS